MSMKFSTASVRLQLLHFWVRRPTSGRPVGGGRGFLGEGKVVFP